MKSYLLHEMSRIQNLFRIGTGTGIDLVQFQEFGYSRKILTKPLNNIPGRQQFPTGNRVPRNQGNYSRKGRV